MSGSATSVLSETSDARFEQDVLDAGGPALVEFFATWCGSCRRFTPTLEKVVGEFAGRVPAVKANADENPELVRRYGVSSTPTLILFSGRKPAGMLVGAQSEDAVRKLLATVAEDRRPAGEPVPAAWAPVDACTLPTAEQPLREAEFDALFATALRGVERPAPDPAAAEPRCRDRGGGDGARPDFARIVVLLVLRLPWLAPPARPPHGRPLTQHQCRRMTR